MIPKMENFFTLRSTGTTWLSSSPTSWVIDTIFAFLCGLGLFLLLLPCFQSNPSLPPARKYRSTRKIQVTEGIKINIWKEKEKDGSYPKQMSPDYHLNSLGNMLKSLDVEQKSPQHFWSTKGKPEQLPGPQQLSYPKVLGHHLQQKYNQLFWGLPSLHSESLVATAWISESSSALQSPSFLFNGISSACPVQMQPKLSPMLSQSKPLSQLEFQSQNLISTIPQFQHAPLTQILTQDHLQSSLPILSSSSSPHIRSQFLIPTEIQHPEWPLLQEQLESGALSSVIKGSQEVFSVFTSNLPEDSWVVSILPENFPISPELRKQLEQHLQKWLVQHRWELPRKIQESLELRQYQGELPGTCQAKGKHGPSRPSAFAGKSSKDTQKVGFQLSQGMGKGLGYILGKVPKDISRASENSNLDKNLENLLTHNLSRKLGQISERMPMSVRQTGMAVNHAFPKSNTDMEIRNLGILKGWRPYVNTSHRVSFLHPDIQGVLEAHIIRFWVRHRWSLPLKVLKPINLFKLKKVQPLPILQFASAPEATCVSGAPSMVKFAEFLGKPSQSCLGKKAIIEESVSTLERPFLAPSPMYGEIQRVLGRAPSGDNKGSLKTFLIGQEDRPPSQSLTLNFMGKTQQSNTSKKLSRMSVFQDPGETCLNEEISEFKSKMNTKSENQLQDYSTNMLLDADNLASQVPQCHPQRVSTGDPVPSQMLYGFITDQRSCLRQQEPMIPKLQDSWKSQSKMTVPTNKREDYRRTSQGECMCHPAPVRGITDSVRSRYIQVPPEKKQGPPESLFRKRVRRFFQWIFPSEKVKGQNALQKCNPIIAPAQSQGPVKSRSIMASETPEAQALMTTVGQILEEKMVIHHGLHATKLNEHKQELQAPVCGYVCYHRLPFYPEQRRIMSYTAHGHQATSKDPSSSIRERQARHQQSLKSVRFKDEQLGLKHFPSPPPKKTLSPVSPCQYGPRMPGVPGHHQHCPRHCLLQGGILSSQP
uniref:SPATA31 domain-containing protein n=1 Tax=Neovison vison TaxID=452646 RepID=A0A8C7AYC5_NEOVI